MTSVWTYTGPYTSSVIFPTGDTITAAPPGTYDVTVTQVTNDGTCSWTLTGITITEIIYGCTTSTANNYCGCTGGSGCNTQGSGYNYNGGNITWCDGACTYDVGGCFDPTAINHLYDCQWTSDPSVSTNSCSGSNVCEHCDSVAIAPLVTAGFGWSGNRWEPQVRHYDTTVVPGYVNIGASGSASGIAWNASGLTGGVAGDTYSVWLTKENDANGVVYDSEDGSLDPLDQTTGNGQSHVFTLDVPTSVFTNPTDTSPADDMEAHVTTYGTWGNSSNLDVHKCDSLLIDDFEQHIYGCKDTQLWNPETTQFEPSYNHDNSVTHTGSSPVNTDNICGSCNHNPWNATNSGNVYCVDCTDPRAGGTFITGDNGTSNGKIEVVFEGFAVQPTVAPVSYTLHAVGISGAAQGTTLVTSGTQIWGAAPCTNCLINTAGILHYTADFSNLQEGEYEFTFESIRPHTKHDGTVVSTACINVITVEVPPV